MNRDDNLYGLSLPLHNEEGCSGGSSCEPNDNNEGG